MLYRSQSVFQRVFVVDRNVHVMGTGMSGEKDIKTKVGRSGNEPELSQWMWQKNKGLCWLF